MGRMGKDGMGRMIEGMGPMGEDEMARMGDHMRICRQMMKRWGHRMHRDSDDMDSDTAEETEAPIGQTEIVTAVLTMKVDLRVR